MKQITNVEFNPIQCTSKQFANFAPMEGALYFLTDTHQIFLGKNNAFVEMCGGVNLHYGQKKIEYDNNGIMPDPMVIFSLADLEEGVMPLKDDLILNIDGCFYRVKDIEDDETISTERLTLQGTGGGGGTGSGSGGSWSFSINGGKAKTYASTATKMEITFKASYLGTDENALASVAFKLKDASEPFYTLDKAMAFNVEHTIDIFKYKHLFGSSKTTVVMYLYDIYGAERSVNLTIQIATLEISSTRKSLLYSMTDTYSYDFTLTGTIDGIEERKAVYELYTENNILESGWNVLSYGLCRFCARCLCRCNQ